MTAEMYILTWTLVLALVQILLAAQFRARETGFAYAAGARDHAAIKPTGLISGRLLRAQMNLFETLPLFIASILVVHVENLEGPMTYWGAMMYFWSRVIYVPLYAMGIPYLRTLVWVIGIIGLIFLIISILHPM